MKKLSALLLIALAVTLSGCTQPGQTTAVGAAAGGVVGAGLGAIVGAQTGSTGAGIAIGAAAGAASGAMVGNALEAQERANRTQDEAIERQEQLIAARGRELDEYRRASDSGAGSRGAAGSAALMGYSYPGSTLRLSPEERARLQRGERLSDNGMRGRYHGDVARRSEATPIRRDVARATPPAPRMSNTATGMVPSASAKAPTSIAKTHLEQKVDGSGLQERDIVEVAPAEVVAKSDSDAGSDFAAAVPQAGFKSPSKELLAANETAAVAMKGAETIPAAPLDISEGAIAEPADVTPAKMIDAAPSVTVSEECKKADAEVSKASESKEPADQLFHYRRALRLCPGKAEYHLGLGRVYQSLKRSSDAEFEFREALRLDPSLTAAKDSLEKVRF